MTVYHLKKRRYDWKHVVPSEFLLIGPINQMSFRKSLEKPQLKFNTLPSLPDSANSRARRRTCSLSSRRFNRSGTPGRTNDNTPPLYASATTA
jgi:hypothetical protein